MRLNSWREFDVQQVGSDAFGNGSGANCVSHGVQQTRLTGAVLAVEGGDRTGEWQREGAKGRSGSFVGTPRMGGVRRVIPAS